VVFCAYNGVSSCCGGFQTRDRSSRSSEQDWMQTMLWKIFVLFTRVAIFSWGGGPASLALMQRETTAAGWLNPAEFADAVAWGNALPGPIAPQVSAYVGYKLAGLPGAVAAATGTVVPTTALMLTLVAYFFAVKDSVTIRAMLRAVRPVVVGLLIWTAYDMGLTVFGAKAQGWGAVLLHGWDTVLIALVAFLVLTFTSINPAIVILAAAAFGFAVYR
jgi:chromate transporter